MSNNKFICTKCTKYYKSYKSLWNHTKIYHKNNPLLSNPNDTTTIHISNPNDTTTIHLSNPNDTTTIHSTNPNDTTIINEVIIENNNLKCKHCNKQFIHRQNKCRHQKKCGEKYFKKCNNLQNQLDNMKKEMDQLRKNILVVINKECKTHPKTLEKINKILSNTTNNTTNNIINSNNIIINNYIIELGQEKVFDVLSEKEKMSILSKKNDVLTHAIEYIHFNERYPQFKNVIITNNTNNIAYKYDSKKKKFIATDKKELIDDIIFERMSDIEEFYDNYEDKLDSKTKSIIRTKGYKYIDKLSEDDEYSCKATNWPKGSYKETMNKKIKLIIYNNRDKVSKEIVRNLEVIV